MIFKTHALVALFTSLAVSSPVLSLRFEEIAEAVGNGGENKFSSVVLYLSKDGYACDSCTPCPGSSVVSIFDSKDPSFCIDCTGVQNPCDKVKVISVFEKDWMIKYFSLKTSNDPASDPLSVELEGSNAHQLGDLYDALQWSKLFYTDEDDDLSFAERGEEEDFVFINTQNFSSYAITFGIQASSNQLSVANYGLVQSCTSQYVSELVKKLIDVEVLTYDSLAPTGGPSLSLAPTGGPSDAPTNNQFDPTSTLTTYVDQGACGPRGDDAKAQLSQCSYGYYLVTSGNFDGWKCLVTINGCCYFSYYVYACK